MPSPTILHLALPTPLRRGFDYLPPLEAPLKPDQLIPGIRVRVPFGRQTLVGILLAVKSETTTEQGKLRHALELLDSQPVLSAEIMRLCLWCADYYHHPVGEVLQAALPGQLRKAQDAQLRRSRCWRHTTEGKGLPATALGRAPKQQEFHQLLLRQGHATQADLKRYGLTSSVARALEEKGLVEATEVEVPNEKASAPTSGPLLAETPQVLNQEQEAAFNQLRYHNFGCFLLEGATGSGKTEVYLHAINRVLQAGRQALILVPEIGLTPQTLKRIEQRFSVPVAELHSNVSEKQRAINWQQAASCQARVIVGTRLAVFTPLPDLGLIIVDEEHDLSFKQQEGLRYSARDLAVVRAKQLNIPLVLGSATPSLESLHNAVHNRYHHLRITRRAGGAQAPRVDIVDLRNQSLEAGLTAPAREQIQATLDRGAQVLIFLNRRGYAPVLLCHHCGWRADCNHCDTRLTLHQSPRHLRCHHCDRRRPIPKQCPNCQSPHLADQGQGTEKVEEALAALFPANDVIRVDRDSMSGRNAIKSLSERVLEGGPCVLVGTQMLAKGHHFPAVALVVIVDVDQGLMSPDFRGPERMGQLIVQVAGRAGRGETAGTVLIQTHAPEHPLLQTLIQQGYHRYARQLLQERQVAQLPPFRAMALLRAESKRADNAIEFLRLANRLAQEITPPSRDTAYLGPLPAFMEKRQGRYRYQLQISCTKRKQLHRLLDQLLSALNQHALAKRTRWSLDVDPLDLA